VVTAFYSDWLKSVQARPPTPSSQAFAAERSRFDPVLFQRVTRTFQRAEKTKTEVAGYDEDPFFNTQDEVAAFRLGTVTRHDATASVPVYAVDVRGGKPRLAVTVKLARSDNGSWRITDVRYPGSSGSDSSLRAWSRQLITPAK
jgi:hypothetical protein